MSHAILKLSDYKIQILFTEDPTVLLSVSLAYDHMDVQYREPTAVSVGLMIVILIVFKVLEKQSNYQ